MQKVTVQDLGRISYKKAWDYQQERLAEVIGIKKHNRTLESNVSQRKAIKHYFLFCEHPPVYTLGKSGSEDNLLLSESERSDKDIEYFKINRGGDITFHGLGQIVGYPIFDLDHFFTDVHKYVRYLEEAIIRTLAEYNIEGTRIKGMTGVWIEGKNGQPNRKICAIGVHLSRWVTMHGFAFNVNTDLNYFNYIIPCGIIDKDKTVTSLQQELGRELDIEIVKNKVLQHFQQLFEFEVFRMSVTL